MDALWDLGGQSVNGVDTLIICDGGRKDPYGFDAAYLDLRGMPIIGYCIKAGVESKYIRKIYLYSDLENKAYRTVRKLFPDEKALEVLRENDSMPVSTPGKKVLKIVPAESKLVMSISKVFYKYIVNDISELDDFKEDWRNANHIRAYQVANPTVRELPIAFMGNDQPLCRSRDLDTLIEDYDPESYDSLLGYTRKEVFEEYLSRVGVSLSEFHRTLRKNDFINGEWMRHNCLFVLKWGKMDNRLIEIISYYNQHRVQSKISNFVRVLLKILSEYRQMGLELFRALGLGCLFAVGKYFKNFNCPLVESLVVNTVSGPEIMERLRRLCGHRIYIYDRGFPGPLMDVDDPMDIHPIKRILEIEEREGISAGR
jgi:hypothetical protein